MTISQRLVIRSQSSCDRRSVVWSHEGKILYKEEGSDDIDMIDTYADFRKLEWLEDKLSELGILQ